MSTPTPTQWTRTEGRAGFGRCELRDATGRTVCDADEPIADLIVRAVNERPALVAVLERALTWIDNTDPVESFVADVMFPIWETEGPIDCLAKVESKEARDLLRARYAEWREMGGA